MKIDFKKRRIIYPLHNNAVLDITKPPFNAVPDGKTDCTKAFCDAIDFVTGEYLKAFESSKKELEAMQDENALISFEVRKVDGKINVPFPRILPKGYIIYLPKGEYLVSDTLSYSHENLYDILFNVRWLEMSAMIRIIGEDRDDTVIRLADGLSAFSFGARRPVINFCKGEKSGVAMSNTLQNLTIDVGKDNPGAVGVRFFCNNTGQISDVVIKSSDAAHRGYAGLEIVDEKVSCGYVKNVFIDGFDYAVRMTSQQHNMAFEHISITNQRISGIYHMGSALSVRDLRSENNVSAVHLVGYSAHLTLIDSELYGGDEDNCAIKAEYGNFYLRNIKISGYGNDLAGYEKIFAKGELPYECVSNKTYSLGSALDISDFDTANIPDSPAFNEDKSGFVSVLDFGAVGDGVTDDTAAIQAAMNSGAEGVLFSNGRYLITDSIIVPEKVKTVDFMFCDLNVGSELAKDETKAALVIKGDTEPILVCNLFAWESFHGLMPLIDHAGTRTLVMDLLHTQGAALYKNSVSGGTVFINGCACTVGGVPGAGARTSDLKNEDQFIFARDIPCFKFKGQTVFARQINPERAKTEIVNDGGKLFILGFKTEEEGTAFDTRNGGITQVMGGMCCIGINAETPVIKNTDSHSLIVLSTMINNPRQKFPLAVLEVRDGVEKTLRDTDMPIRAMLSYFVPKYIS